MDASYSHEEKNERIQEVLYQMGLKKVENTRIGAPGAANSISGGEMKRLSVASEVTLRLFYLIASVWSLFMDFSIYELRWATAFGASLLFKHRFC